MNHIVREDSKSWDNSKLATCFVDCMSNLWIGLQKEIIKDAFYPDVNYAYLYKCFNDDYISMIFQLNLLEDRLDKKIVSECCQCLGTIVRKFLRTEDLREFFPTL